ncbi:uncharacterized protein LAESUDRAFT_631004, partial [Laetiporus sulphureus 93-53]
ALVNSGAYSMYISKRFVKNNRIATSKLNTTYKVYNDDGDHGSTHCLLVTDIQKLDMIIGMSYLCQNNPEINWQAREWKYSQCPSTC